MIGWGLWEMCVTAKSNHLSQVNRDGNHGLMKCS